jgi:hypothetical protein
VKSGLHLGPSEADNDRVTAADSKDDFQSEGNAVDDAGSINLDAIADFGPPVEPRPESRVAAVMQRLEGQALIWCLIAWIILIVVAVAVRVPALFGSSSHGESTNTTNLVVGALAAAGGAIVAVLAVRSKQRDHAGGTESARIMGVSWSTRWLLGGVVVAVIGITALWSAR